MGSNFNPASVLVPILVASELNREQEEKTELSKKRRSQMSAFITLDTVEVTEHIFKDDEIKDDAKVTINIGTIIKFYESAYSTNINPITLVDTDDERYLVRGTPKDIQRKIDEANEKLIKKE